MGEKRKEPAEEKQQEKKKAQSTELTTAGAS